MYWWNSALLLLAVLMGVSATASAQDVPPESGVDAAPVEATEPVADATDKEAQPVEPSVAPSVPVEPAQPVVEQTQPSTEANPEAAPAAEEATPEDVPATEDRFRQSVLIQTRSGISWLHAYTEGDMSLETGFEVSFQSKDLGVMLFWYYHHPLDFDDVMLKPKVDFSYQLGFGFQYYPFGEGPSGLYTGPGFCAWHINKDPDPIEAAVAPQMEQLDKEVKLYTFKRGNQPYDMLGPFWMVGYRYLIPEHSETVSFVIGADMRIGGAFSDRLEYQDHSFYWSLSPNIGMAF